MPIESIIASNTAAIERLTAALEAVMARIIVSPGETPPAPEPVIDIPAPSPVKDLDVRALFIELGKVCGKDAQMAVLKEFGAAKLSQVDPAQHGVVAQVIQGMISEAGNA